MAALIESSCMRVFRRKAEVPVTLHSCYVGWDSLLQTLTANAIRSFPQNR